MNNKHINRTIRAVFFTCLFFLISCAGNRKSNATKKDEKFIHFNKKDNLTVYGYIRKINNIKGIIPLAINDLICRYYNKEIDPDKLVCLKTLKRDYDDVTSIVCSPDGKNIAIGYRSGMIIIWDAKTDKKLFLDGHEKVVHSLSYSSDGKQLASASEDRTTKIWDTKTGELLEILEKCKNTVRSAIYSPDGEYIATGNEGDGIVKIWYARTRKLFKSLDVNSDYIRSITYSPDGQHFAIGNWEDIINVWNTETGKLVTSLELNGMSTRSIIYSPDGKHIASVINDNEINICNAKTGEIEETFEEKDGYVSSIVYSPGGRYIARGHGDGMVKFWDVETKKNIGNFKGWS